MANRRRVVPGPNGGWNVLRPHARRASALFLYRDEAIANARASLDEEGGGTVVADGHAGRERRSEHDAPRHSPDLSDLANQTVHDVAALVHSELELAKAEMRDEARSLAIAGALVFGGVSLVVAALLALVWAAAWALAEVVPAGASFAIVGVGLLMLSAAAIAAGTERVRRVELLPRTRAIVREKTS